MKINITAVILTVCTFISIIFLVSRSNALNPYYTYGDMNDIKVEYVETEEVAKIHIKDTYKKAGETYYEFTTSATGNELFTFSKEEYNKAFGAGNNAFDCRIYKLKLESPLCRYKHAGTRLGFRGTCLLCTLQEEDITKYGNDTYHFNNQGIMEQLLSDENVNLSLHVEHKEQNINMDVISYVEEISFVEKVHYLGTTCEITRYDFLGENAFNENEIEMYMQEVDDLNQYLMTVLLETQNPE